MSVTYSLAVVLASVFALSDAARFNKDKEDKGLKVKHTRSWSSCGIKGANADASSALVQIGKGPNATIVNGRPAPECAWRWQVGLKSSLTGSPWCGGMLIQDDWVLTAAHCVRNPNFHVVAGDYEKTTPGGTEQHRMAVQVFRHPQYNAATINWDFALVRLETPVELNECTGTVCLPTEGADVSAGAACWITGWGTLASGGQSPEKLQEAEVNIIDSGVCGKAYSGDMEITDAMVCAQGRNANGDVTDACQGDSGGPLVCQNSDQTWGVYGATSWGRGCADAAAPGVWARVHEAVPWIEETLEANSGPAPTIASCPGFALNPYPDSDGDCQCPFGDFCSVSGGANRDCPTANGGIGSWGGSYFMPGCENCQCFGR